MRCFLGENGAYITSRSPPTLSLYVSSCLWCLQPLWSTRGRLHSLDLQVVDASNTAFCVLMCVNRWGQVIWQEHYISYEVNHRWSLFFFLMQMFSENSDITLQKLKASRKVEKRKFNSPHTPQWKPLSTDRVQHIVVRGTCTIDQL